MSEYTGRLADKRRIKSLEGMIADLKRIKLSLYLLREERGRVKMESVIDSMIQMVAIEIAEIKIRMEGIPEG